MVLGWLAGSVSLRKLNSHSRFKRVEGMSYSISSLAIAVLVCGLKREIEIDVAPGILLRETDFAFPAQVGGNFYCSDSTKLDSSMVIIDFPLSIMIAVSISISLMVSFINLLLVLCG